MARRSSRLLFLISPTKTLDLEPLAAPLHALMTTRRFAGLTEALVADVQTLKKPQLKKVFKGVSDAITNLNHTRFKEWSTNDEKSAAYAFDGPAFKGLAFSTLTTADRAYAQDNFRILSGLYGLLRPLDGIKPYRLEMGSKLPLALDNAEEPSDSGTTTLYSYWGDRLANAVLADLDIESDDGSDATADALSSRIVLNIASQEYWKAAREATLLARGVRVVHCKFCEPGGRVISVYAKRARGMMARFLIEARAESVEDATAFEGYTTMESYKYSAAQSSESELVFIHTKSAVKTKTKTKMKTKMKTKGTKRKKTVATAKKTKVTKKKATPSTRKSPRLAAASEQ